MVTVNFKFNTSEQRIKQAFDEEGKIVTGHEITLSVNPTELTRKQRSLLMNYSRYSAPYTYTLCSTYDSLTLDELLCEIEKVETRKSKEVKEKEDEQRKRDEQKNSLRTLAANEGFQLGEERNNYFYLMHESKQVSSEFSISEEEGAHETFSKLMKSYKDRVKKEAGAQRKEQEEDTLKVRVAQWISERGSELAKLRLKHNFEYMKLVGRENAQVIIENDPVLSDFKLISDNLYDQLSYTNQHSEPPLEVLQELDLLANHDFLESLDVEYRHLEDCGDQTEYWIVGGIRVVSGVEIKIAKSFS